MSLARTQTRRGSTGPDIGADTPAAVLAARSGVRMRPARPARALLGALLVVAAVVSALALYARVGDRTKVLALTRTVLAGEQVTAADLSVVGVSSDDDVAWVEADERDMVVGQYAKFRLPQGALLVGGAVQSQPLVTPGFVVVGVSVPTAQIPVGVREQSRLVLVVESPATGGPATAPILVEATVVAVPANLAELVGATSSGSPSFASMSVEVEPRYAAVVASASSVGIALTDPLVAERATPVPDAAAGPSVAVDAGSVAAPAPSAEPAVTSGTDTTPATDAAAAEPTATLVPVTAASDGEP